MACMVLYLIGNSPLDSPGGHWRGKSSIDEFDNITKNFLTFFIYMPIQMPQTSLFDHQEPSTPMQLKAMCSEFIVLESASNSANITIKSLCNLNMSESV